MPSLMSSWGGEMGSDSSRAVAAQLAHARIIGGANCISSRGLVVLFPVGLEPSQASYLRRLCKPGVVMSWF